MAYKNFPSGLDIDRFILSNAEFTYTTDLFSGGVESEPRNLQQFELSISLIMNKADYRRYESFISGLKGRSTPFYITIPDRCSSLLKISTAVTTKKTHKRGLNTIELNDFRGTFSPGDFVTFDNDTKVYTVTNTVKNSGSIEIHPTLRKDLAVNAGVKFKNVKFLVRLDDDVSKYTYDSHLISKVKIKAKEVINAPTIIT